MPPSGAGGGRESGGTPATPPGAGPLDPASGAGGGRKSGAAPLDQMYILARVKVVAKKKGSTSMSGVA